MPTLYSRPLSREAHDALVDFVAAYVESLRTQIADEKAEAAKEKAIACLQTDIDIRFLDRDHCDHAL
jgi:catabolite regulation protein CreA